MWLMSDFLFDFDYAFLELNLTFKLFFFFVDGLSHFLLLLFFHDLSSRTDITSEFWNWHLKSFLSFNGHVLFKQTLKNISWVFGILFESKNFKSLLFGDKTTSDSQSSFSNSLSAFICKFLTHCQTFLGYKFQDLFRSFSCCQRTVVELKA